MILMWVKLFGAGRLKQRTMIEHAKSVEVIMGYDCLSIIHSGNMANRRFGEDVVVIEWSSRFLT